MNPRNSGTPFASSVTGQATTAGSRALNVERVLPSREHGAIADTSTGRGITGAAQVKAGNIATSYDTKPDVTGQSREQIGRVDPVSEYRKGITDSRGK